MTDIKKMFVRTIRATKNPAAPMVVAEAYSSVNALGKMLVGVDGVTKAHVEEMTNMLLEAFDEGEISEVAGSPEFIMALCGMLSISIKDWVAKLED